MIIYMKLTTISKAVFWREIHPPLFIGVVGILIAKFT